jgi:hypothetical protein
MQKCLCYLFFLLFMLLWLCTGRTFSETTQPQSGLTAGVAYHTGFQQQQKTASILISTNRFHIGDAQFAPQSSAAPHFLTPSHGPEIILHFTLSAFQAQSFFLKSALVFHHVVGLDTVGAHKTGQSSASSHSTPAIVRVNGNVIGQLCLNGDLIVIPLVGNVLRLNQPNEVRISGGIRLEKSTRMDVDDFEWQGLTLISPDN